MYFKNGPQATRTLRSNGYNKLIIGVTGCALEDDLDEYVQSGADLLVVKPMSMATLNCILSYVEEHGTDSRREFKLKLICDKLVWVSRAWTITDTDKNPFYITFLILVFRLEMVWVCSYCESCAVIVCPYVNVSYRCYHVMNFVLSCGFVSCWIGDCIFGVVLVDNCFERSELL